MRTPYQISFSGGRTSAYMTKMLIDNMSDQYEFIVLFANTGLEHPKTLDFVNNCDKHFNFNSVWIEAVTNPEHGKGITHNVVTYETASRKGEPFESYISKYGIPNRALPQCTSRLKLEPFHDYLRSIGIKTNKIPTAIGIRFDEQRRISKTMEEVNIKYPLIHLWPTNKGEILHWWKKQEFDLGLEEFEGNCFGCFKKSHKKLFMQIRKDPTVFEFHRRMEKLYRDFKTEKPNGRVFFNGHLDTDGLFKLHDHLGDYMFSQMDLFQEDDNGGCTESCELYPMEIL